MPVNKGSEPPKITNFFTIKQDPRKTENVLQTKPQVARRSESWWSGKKQLGAPPARKIDFGSGRPQLKRESSIYEPKPQSKRQAVPMKSTGWMAKQTVSKPLVRAELSSEQNKILQLVRSGKSIFYTGAAGTGKSFLLREIIRQLRMMTSDPTHIAVCATTGLASQNIGGETVHSWSGMGVFNQSPEFYAKKFKTPGKTTAASIRWSKVKVLIIDEVSMLSGEIFEKLETVARRVRNTDKVFGGIQVIVTGDFFQLPPVDKHQKERFCFESDVWKKLIGENQLVLHKVFRQQESDKLVAMLNEMRLGAMSPSTISLFKELKRKVEYKDGLEATQLFATRFEVDKANRARLSALQGTPYTFKAYDAELLDVRNDPFRDHVSQKELTLKVGSQVLMIMNKKDVNLVNGSRGRVITFVTEDGYGFLEKLFMDYGRDEVIRLYNLVLENQGSNQAIQEKMEALLDPEAQKTLIDVAMSGGTNVAWERVPLVDFPEAGWRLITRETFEVNGPPPRHDPIATRSQIPLILSYSLSVHKAQGQTIDRLVVDLNSTFVKGQAYVAVSRATSFDRLQVIGFQEAKVQANEKVVEFYNNLAKV